MRNEDSIGKGVFAGIHREDGKYVCAACLHTSRGEGRGDPVFKSTLNPKIKCKLCKKRLDRFWKEKKREEV